MSFNYSGDPSASRLDECRFLIGDTDESNFIFQDEEINYIITQAGDNDNLLKYNLFTRAATVYAKAIKRSLGPQSEDPTARLKFFNEQAMEYKAKLSVTGMSLPKFSYPKIFHKGMHSNPPWSKPKGGTGYV